MAFDAYLKIDGIPGESLDTNHKDWIELLSFEFGASQATSATASSAGGASAERVNLSEFAIQEVHRQGFSEAVRSVLPRPAHQGNHSAGAPCRWRAGALHGSEA